MKNVTQKIILQGILVLALCIVSTAPNMVQANYTVNGRTFATQAECQHYLDEYMKAWREVYGYSGNVKTSTVQHATTKSSYIINATNAKNVGPTNAQLIGSTNFQNSKLIRVWFEYGVQPNNLYISTESEVLSKNSGYSKFDRNISNLQPETQYYFRAVGLNDKGVYAYSNVQSFVTDVDIKNSKALIKVSVSGAGDTQDNRTTLRGTVDFRKQTFAHVWFQYGEEEKDLYRETPRKLVYKTGGKSFEHTLTTLSPQTNYYYRIVGQDQYGKRSYSKTVRVTTKKYVVGEKPKVTTAKAQVVDAYSATLGGSVDMNSYRNGVAFLVYGENQEYIKEIAKKYTQYKTIKPRGDDLQKVLLDNDVDNFKKFSTREQYLDFNTKHFYAIGVEYENDDGDSVLLLGNTITFTTIKI